MQLQLEYPAYWGVLCVLLGLLLAYVLYRVKGDRLQISKGLRFVLAGFRALVISSIAFLLLAPFFQYLERQVQKPLILIAQDNSSSVLLHSDSAYYLQDLPQGMQVLRERLEEKYEVQDYVFDKELRRGAELDYQGKRSDLGLAIEEVRSRNVNRNIGALVLASDGLYNQGLSPYHLASGQGFPVYTLALGDTTIHKDLVIDGVKHNSLAYLGNRFPIEVSILAERLAGKEAVLTIRSLGQELLRENVKIEREGQLIERQVLVEAKTIGRQRVDITISPLDAEKNKENNYRSVYIEVLDSRQKLMLVYDAPHPDIAALRSALNQKEQYELELFQFDEAPQDVSVYDMCILHSALRSGASRNLMQKIKSAELPVFLMAASGIDHAFAHAQGFGASFQARGSEHADCQAALSEGFPLFTLDENLKSSLPEWSPLRTAFGDYVSEPGAQVLFMQRIGLVNTKAPLWLFHRGSGQMRMGYLLGEGIWRWRLQDFAQNGNHQRFDDLMSKTIQFLASKEDKRKFRVFTENRFDEDESVLFRAEFYNQSYELINDPDARVQLEDEEGKEYEFTFSRSKAAYQLNAGRLPVGSYTYTALLEHEGERYSQSGQISIEALQVEALRTSADHDLLSNIAEASGAELYYPRELEALAEDILSKEQIVPIIHTSKRNRDILDIRWILFLFVALLSVEWFLRKFKGGY